MKIEYHLILFLILLAILILIWLILRSIQHKHGSQQELQERKAKTPRPLKPKTEDDCLLCLVEKGSSDGKPGNRQPPRPWSEVRDRRGRKKTLSTQGRGCNNRKCIYYHIMDEGIHALVGYGSHGKHELCERMPSGCTPIFTSDGLRLYFYALTAHFGHWVLPEGVGKLIWEIAAGFIYAQVKKIHRRRKLVKVEHLMLCGEREKLTTGLKALGLSGKINTAFVERLNLTMD
jgi:hypothetical protein